MPNVKETVKEIVWSPTMESVLSELSGEPPLSAWELVKRILRKHPRYGDGQAREVLSGPVPDLEIKKSAEEWGNEIKSLFDPSLVPKVHGRLAILGLCRLDKGLARHLRGFVIGLEKELFEDFDSLLEPEVAGREAYRREFLYALQNRSKFDPNAEKTTRTRGFLVLARGGPYLETLVRLCFRQRWNDCLTGRYVLSPGSKLNDFLRAVVADLRGLARGDASTVGDLLPESKAVNPLTRATPPSWRKQALALRSALEKLADDSTDAEILDALFSAWEGDTVLKTGHRLVLFAEWRGVPGSSSAEELGFNSEVVARLASLPERVGLVLWGLPESIRSVLAPDTFTVLELPPDTQQMRGQAVANDVPDGPDRLNIIGEVRALAEAIALEDMSPPLVVGVLGGWGAGKSFVLHLLEERLHEIRCERIQPADEAGPRFPFVGHPYLVRFDAWTYAKGDLWASLMQTTLLELDRQLTLERELSERLGLDLKQSTEVWRLLGRLSDKQRQRLFKTELGRRALEVVEKLALQGSPGRLWSELDKLRSEAKDELQAQEPELREMRRQVAQARHRVENLVDEEIAADARRTAWLPVWGRMLEIADGKLEEQDAPTYDELVKKLPFSSKFLVGVKELSFPLWCFVGVSAAAGFLLPNLTDVARWLSGSAGVLVAAMTPVVNALDWLRNQRKAYDERLVQAQGAKVASREQRIEHKIANPEPDSPAAEFVTLRSRARSKEAEVERLREQVGITARHRSLRDFVQERIEGEFYEQKLGLLHEIQKDMAELSDTLLPGYSLGTEIAENTAALFPRGAPRVFLLIDDLDRCPPAKVVEVLEAAQLLVKTRLFVVVIAMDVRYITRALEAEYEGVLVRNGEPSGLDYIEKIIQIPYRVRISSTEAVGSFLRSQMEFAERGESEQEESEQEDEEPSEEEQPEPETTDGREDDDDAVPQRPVLPVRTELRVLPTKVLYFTKEEHEAISACCGTVEVSPRAMKRLVNVFKLLKIIWYRDGREEGPEPSVKQAMLALLVLAARFPEVVRQLLASMEAAYRSRSSPGGVELVEFLGKRCHRGARSALYPPDWLRVRAALEDEEFFPKGLTFSEFEEANLHLVSSFSFVGETDSEREAALQRAREPLRQPLVYPEQPDVVSPSTTESTSADRGPGDG